MEKPDADSVNKGDRFMVGPAGCEDYKRDLPTGTILTLYNNDGSSNPYFVREDEAAEDGVEPHVYCPRWDELEPAPPLPPPTPHSIWIEPMHKRKAEIEDKLTEIYESLSEMREEYDFLEATLSKLEREDGGVENNE
jgi:hypothetical protein